MMKELLRTIGIGCLVAGGVLYFTGQAENPSDSDSEILQSKLEKTEEELARAKEALAMIQTSSSTDQLPSRPAEQETKREQAVPPGDEQPASSKDPVKTVLAIQPGSNSTTVSTALERLGIVKDGNEFEMYLVSQKLAGKIQIGEYELDSTMDYKTIARTITSPK
ncbi:aminodeoxychorismate lyase [Bacillus sp. OxB-1]|uniref:endolytic transglycosylase MltG n=1 Tax=Bacillus sp. (strain OxB-1) TaxID=98228 RepID=UPI000581E3E1|nr:endolytic transglycosylase MltG [Bacillus sp. OxB-1]BAQ11374.1 aminodeoxychorismate lyase [Bacillus sp. OxB-1]